jgi:hypothetical protein
LKEDTPKGLEEMEVTGPHTAMKICEWFWHMAGGLDSSVGVATGYGLDGPGIEFQWERDFSHMSRPALGPAKSPVQWVLGLSRRGSGWGVVLATHPFLVLRSRNNRAIPLSPPAFGSVTGYFYLYLLAYGWVVIDHLPYSPSLAISNVHLSEPFKNRVAGEQFVADDDCRLMFLWLWTFDTGLFCARIQGLLLYCEKGLNSHGSMMCTNCYPCSIHTLK